jgi:predicted AlkP superfamily phosphohydrolase/phosphomutase
VSGFVGWALSCAEGAPPQMGVGSRAAREDRHVRSLRRTLAVVAIGLALLVCLLAGCGRGGPVNRRLLIVGIDSADWGVVTPLLDDGRLPNLAKLMERGVSSDLRSLEPAQKSPVIWTTIATGKSPDKHGIGDALDRTGTKIMTSNMRRVRTVWDILGEAGTTVTVIGWLVSWPAEELNGYMVTDYFRFAPSPDRALPENLTYPDELLSEVEGLRVAADAVTDEELLRFARFDEALTEDEAKKLPLKELFVEMRVINQLDRMTGLLRSFIAADRTFAAVAKHLIGKRPTDVCAVYIRGADSASHQFWRAAHPDDPGLPVSHTERRVFGRTVERYYEYADEMLGELVEEYGEDGTIMVCSDHGFKGPKPGQPSGGINDHGPVGILVIAGDGVREGVRIGESSVRDITPTILALYGLPVAEDMDGRVIEEALEPTFLERHPVTSVATYEETD